MTGLKMIANDGVSKIRTREEKLLADQRKYKDEIAAMEQKLYAIVITLRVKNKVECSAAMDKYITMESLKGKCCHSI